jgi:epoxyqueuosine reductase QueG
MALNYNKIVDSFSHKLNCVIGCSTIDNLNERERKYFETFMPIARTVIVLGHHVTKKSEWTWYATDDGNERCDADDHTSGLCCLLKEKIELLGFSANIVPYPEESGLQFRYVAQSAGLGKIGKNAFLLHPDWGPWIHLRIIATEATFEMLSAPFPESVCTECGECIEACPAEAITDRLFEGLKCDCHNKLKGGYTPFGPEKELVYCEICAQVCPIGDKPEN